MKKPFISVVIPALNEAKNIQRCLKAIEQQRFDGVEIIVVDNGSTDRTVKLAQAFDCKVIYEYRHSVSAARQTGFLEASGGVIASTDADTIIGPDWLGQIAAEFLYDPELIGLYGPVHLQGFRKIVGKQTIEKAFGQFLNINQKLKRPHFCGANFAVRRDAFLKTGGFRHRHQSFYQKAEDVQLSLKLKQLGQIRYQKDLVVFTSPRRLNGAYFVNNTKTYLKVVWLKKTC